MDQEISEQRREAHIAHRLQMMRVGCGWGEWEWGWDDGMMVNWIIVRMNDHHKGYQLLFVIEVDQHVLVDMVMWRRRGARKEASSLSPMLTFYAEDHDVLWPDLPRTQPTDAFYSHSNKCKKCYIWLQQERIRRQRAGYVPDKERERLHIARQRVAAQQAQIQTEEKIHDAFFPWAMSGKKKTPAKSLVGDHEPEEEITPQMLLDVPPVAPSALYAMYPESEGSLDDALLLLPHVQVPPAATASPAVGLRHAATAAVWGRAIMTELRDHPYSRAARAELDQLDVDVEQGSLRQLEDALCRVLTVAMHRNAGKIESAQLNQLIIHVRARAQEAKALLKQTAGREGGLCGACNQSADPSPGSGAPLFCSGLCGRVFHAGCAGNPDEVGWQCDECKQGKLVLHYDARRRDWYTNVPDEGETNKNWDAHGPFIAPRAKPTDARSVGKLLRAARRNHVLMSEAAEAEEQEAAAEAEEAAAPAPSAQQPRSKRRAKIRDDDDYRE